MSVVSLIVLLGTLICTFPAHAAFFGIGDSRENVTAKEGKITITVSTLETLQSRRYCYREGGKEITFFIVRDGQGTIRAALDACEVCWQAGKGYQLTDDGMVCVNCGRKFALNRIGIVKGGCNPHPFRFWTDNATVEIETQELILGAEYFPENRR